ncbi:MAG: hypothetical protein V1936_03530 [Patescibacteria group bacterium]
MNSKILDEIVADLIALDPKFAKIEVELRRLAAKLLAAKPDAEMDLIFRQRLRGELRAQASDLKIESEQIKLSNSFSMQKLFFALGGAALAVVLFFSYQQLENHIAFDFSAGIESVGPKAFGSLANDSGAAPAMGKGGGGGGAAAEMAYRDGAIPEFTITKFVYRGSINLPTSPIQVLKRVKNQTIGGSLLQSLADFNFGLADFSSLQNLKLQNFGFAEDRDRGYAVYVGAEDGSVSISQNWQKWPNVYDQCNGAAQDCYEKNRMKEGDMLSDQEDLRIAADFVQKFGVDLQSFGQPEIFNSWREELARSTEKIGFYFPEQVAVIYPLQVAGQKVYNDGGTVDGLTVNIDQRLKAATGLWNLQTQKYQASAYEPVRDEKLFRKFLERGGLWNWIPENSQNARIVEVELGDPEMVLLKYWNYQDNENTELLIPALRFPVVKVPEGEYVYQKAIVIPLAAEILANQDKNQPVPYLNSEPVKIDSAITPLDSTRTEALADCPQLAPVGPDFCPNGKIVQGEKDANGCLPAPTCQKSDAEKVETPAEQNNPDGDNTEKPSERTPGN